MISPCKCKRLPEYFKADTSDPDFSKFQQIDWKKDAWVKLIQCPDCGQHWQLDQWDKYQSGLAVKIEEPDRWRQFCDKIFRIPHLVQSRGGLSQQTFAWHGCENKALMGLAYCPLCAYERSGLRE